MNPRDSNPYNDLYGEAPPERGTCFRLQVYKRVGFSQAEVYKRVGKSVIWVFERAFKRNISNKRTLFHFLYKIRVRVGLRGGASSC